MIPVFIGTFVFGAVATRVTSHYGNYQGKSLTISASSMHLPEVKNLFFFCDGLWKTGCQRSDQRELFMGTDSEEEPDESGDD